MTITRLWQCGFELISEDEIDGVGDVNAYYNTTTYARSGTRSNRTRTELPNCYFYKDVPDTRQIRTGFDVYMQDIGNLADGEIVSILSGTAHLLDIKLSIASNDLILLINGSQEDITTDSPITTAAHFHFAIDYKIDPASGWANVYLNNDLTPILSFSGNTGDCDLNRVTYGVHTDMYAGANYYWYWDDCYIDDTTGESATQPPLLRFEWIYPNANGYYAQWAGSDGNSDSNYQLVDERPANLADYVAATGSNQYDSYGMTTYTIVGNEQLNAVIPIVYGQRYGADELVALGTRYSGTSSLGVYQDPGFGSWKYVWERQTTKPIGGNWDQDSLNNVEVVMLSTGTF